MNKFIALVFLLALASAAVAQNAPIPTLPFSFTATAVNLPGAPSTFVGTDAGVSVQPNEYVSFSEHNILSTDGRLSYYAGGIDYFFPSLSLAVNNKTPVMSGFRLLFSIGASFGDARVLTSSGRVSHWGEEFHGSVSYAVTSGGAWQLGLRAGAGRFPYFAKSAWTPIIEAGPSLHF